MTAPDILPVALLLHHRPVLLVGGGRVAARKAVKLSASGAELTVIAPVIKEAVRAVPGVRFIERAFEDGDLAGFFMVFAVTDNPELNSRIIELCRREKILCASADNSWPDGDLILPASFSEDGLTVSISTSGRSCRRSRLLRESLSRHMRFMSGLDLLIAGADYTSGFQTLEEIKTRRAEIEKIAAGVHGIHEFMILDTCNRFELIGLVSAQTDPGLFLKGLPFCFKQADAFRRFAEIAAGLHSQAFGENRIVAQIKQALAEAQEKGFAGSFLQGWTDTALHISKEIRQALTAGSAPLETEDLAVQWLERNAPGAKAMLIIGRGEIGQGLARRFPSAAQISGRSDDEIRRALPSADVILCATASESFVLDEPHRDLLRSGAVLLDLSLPRNINPALPSVTGLNGLRAAAPEKTEAALAKARQITDAHRREYERLIRFQ
jgi:siroheme synthase-like protein